MVKIQAERKFLIDLTNFKQYMQLQNLSKGTIDNYVYELSKLPGDKNLQTSFLIENRNRRMLMSAYRKYLHYLRSIGKIDGEILFNKLDTYKLPKRRGQSKKGNWYKQDEWNAIVSNGKDRCARMFLWLGFQFGFRLSEIINLRLEDVDLENKRLLVRQHPENIGKNQDYWHPKHFRDRSVPIAETKVRVLKRWIKERPDLDHPYLLWSGRTKKKLSKRVCQRWTQDVRKGLKPHDLRRSFAKVLYYNSDKDLKLVQITLGHASISTTSTYLGLEEEEVQEKFSKAMS